jgi:hypothetical protein
MGATVVGGPVDGGVKGRAALLRGGASLSFLAVLSSMFWPWTTHGTGSSVPGHRLASLLLQGRADLWHPRWMGAALFLVPLSGSVGLAAVVLEGKSAAIVRVAAIVLATAISVVVLASLHKLSLHGIGPGGALAVGGCVGAGVFSVLGKKESRR